MNTKMSMQYYDMLDDEGMFDRDGKDPRDPKSGRSKKPPASDRQFIAAQDDSRTAVTFTYHPARFEEAWLINSLGYFLEQKWISDVLRKLKGGKEASVYLCRSGTQVGSKLLAVKVFRPRSLRNLKNDRLYLQGRDVLGEDGKQILDLGMLKAHHKRSVYGESIRHQSWIMYEFQTLKKLSEAGADVPRPYETSHNAILMDYIGSEEMSAPTLNTVSLNLNAARLIFERLVANIGIMLKLGLVHGDLSAYNVLYWQDSVVLIDFPQVVYAARHPAAYRIFQRDIVRLCAYFESQGLECHPGSLASRLWKEAGYREKAEIPAAILDADNSGSGEL